MLLASAARVNFETYAALAKKEKEKKDSKAYCLKTIQNKTENLFTPL